MASEAPSTERDGNRWALLYITAPTLDPTAAVISYLWWRDKGVTSAALSREDA